MTALRTEGILLRTLDFQDHHQIATLFSPDQGIMKLILKGNGRSKGSSSRISPLMQVECVYVPGKGELCKTVEISILNPLLSLRDRLVSLNAACDLAHTIISSQWPGKPSPLLYELLFYYLKKIPQIAQIQAALASFHLKVLKHDGLIGEHLEEQYLPFSSDEKLILLQLLACRTIREIDAIFISTELLERIKHFFVDKIKN